MLVRQALYHMNHFTSPVLGIFKIESLEIFDCAGFKP
jgi:hypothetical protein